ncbi:hypothetical protein [Burkholderia ubonensis]|uniref:hypothetical protein n=1 Tax=Burkholderia ubonensis TaxID=101571 RepID=UPI00075A0872|nr:hypothetical protein [Burkholderia ubonensis]KVN28365.1 hypothetical protein WJ64_16650 [Burkholderia ubonensis]
MNDISELEQVLSGLAQEQDFKLDNRTLQSTLDFLVEYLANIPYGERPHADDEIWGRIFFMGKTPAQLSEIAANPALAGGVLWPQQALLLAFLELLETPRALLNYIPYAHRELYYRQLLGLSEREAEPAHVALSFQLAANMVELPIPSGTLFSAGQDRKGVPIQYALNRQVLANQGRWTDLRWCWRPQPDGLAMSYVGYDEAQKLPWPERGHRLFSVSPKDSEVVTGRMLASAALDVPEREPNFFEVLLHSDVASETVSLARISSGDQWLQLINTSTPGETCRLEFELPANMGPVRAPAGLDGMTLDVPVLQLGRDDELLLPDIQQLKVNTASVNFASYVLTPFGYSNQPQPVEQDQLYLGFAGLRPGQSLSLYWRLQGAKALTPRWQYLNRANQWAALDATVVDETLGLFRSGLWSSVLPLDACDTAPAMPTGRYWLRAVMDGVSASSLLETSDYPIVIGLVTNGMTATMLNASMLDSASLERSLPADTISQPVNPIAGLSKTLQPWPSWGGRPVEATSIFFERAAQRLAHRHRALTWGDMVEILKAGFRAVFDVATPARQRQAETPAQREQRLIVIPLNTEKDNADPLRPMLNHARRADMAAYLQRLASPWQNIVVDNPSYRDVEIAIDVRFRPGVNPDYGYRQLRQALDRHYMPWIGDEPGGVKLANRLDYYGVVEQAQQQPDVECVIYLTLDGEQQSIQGEDNEVLILVWAVGLHSGIVEGAGDGE